LSNRTIAVPTVRGIGSAFGDYTAGLIGGVAYNLLGGMFGNGFLGSIAVPLITGSMLSGARGTALSTMAGFQAAPSILGGLVNNAPASSGRGEI
tara:strand:- start:194 stop:475 length:282 start_codon:yes stop_codon:yes gene_type:complete